MSVESSRNRVLPTLGRIYGFAGRQTSTDQVDLTNVQLVHDVSREAELTQGFPHVAVVPSTTAGAGVAVFTAVTLADYIGSVVVNTAAGDPAAQLLPRNLQPMDVDIWLLGVAAMCLTAETGNLAAFNVGFRFPTPAGASSGQIRPIQRYTTTVLGEYVNNGMSFLSPVLSSSIGSLGVPILLPQDRAGAAFITMAQDDAGGALTGITALFYTWIAPKGVGAPGSF